jgi:hypothetical protein
MKKRGAMISRPFLFRVADAADDFRAVRQYPVEIPQQRL